MVVAVKKKYVIGVDFGGTNLKVGVGQRDGKLLSFVSGSSFTQDPMKKVIDRIIFLINESIDASNLNKKQIMGVCIGACGLINIERGIFISSSVIPTWNDVPLSEIISTAIELPVLLDNDANAAIYGEWFAGVAKGFSNVIGMTLGTGIGGAAILNSNLYYGGNCHAGEFGHMTVQPYGPKCYCGNRGCLGKLASGNGMVRRYKKLLQQGKTDYSKSYENLKEITSESIFKAAQNGEEIAGEVINDTGRYLGIGAANVLSCFNPNMLVFTGGLTKMGFRLLSIIRDEAYGRVYPEIRSEGRIEFGNLGDRAGVIGAVGILFNKINCNN